MSRTKRKDNYKFVAVAVEEGSYVPYFEKSKTFRMYYLENGALKNSEVLSLFPKSTDIRIQSFRDSMVDEIICRNFGPKAMHALKSAGFKLYTFEGGADAAISAYLNGELQPL